MLSSLFRGYKGGLISKNIFNWFPSLKKVQNHYSQVFNLKWKLKGHWFTIFFWDQDTFILSQVKSWDTVIWHIFFRREQFEDTFWDYATFTKVGFWPKLTRTMTSLSYEKKSFGSNFAEKKVSSYLILRDQLSISSSITIPAAVALQGLRKVWKSGGRKGKQ